MNEWRLLREYVEHNSDAAFAALVERYINLAYTACFRELRDASLAEDVTQVVFLILAQKAYRLREGTVLSGWLYRTARFASNNARQQEILGRGNRRVGEDIEVASARPLNFAV